MVWFLVLLLTEPPVPALEIKLENRGMYLDRIEFGRVRILRDGSFLANTFHHIWHWDERGGLINQLGGYGQGPGELEAMSEVLFDGRIYWAIDGARMLSVLFDKAGNFLFNAKTNIRQFVRTPDRLFVVDNSKFGPAAGPYPRTLQEVSYQLTPEELRITKRPLAFRKITPRQAELGNTFKLLWVVRDSDRYFVMDQIEPRIQVFDADTRDQEQKISDQKSYLPPQIPLRLPHWVAPPAAMRHDFRSNDTLLTWWYSWSRVTFFGRMAEDLLVIYEVPDPQNPRGFLSAVTRIGEDGRPRGRTLLVEGQAVGAKEGLALVFQSGGNPDRFDYFIRGYRL